MEVIYPKLNLTKKMGLLDSLFSNERVMNAAFSSVKGLMKSNNIKYIVIQLDENGEIDPQMYREVDSPIVTSAAQMQKIKEIMTEQASTIAQYAEENARLRAQATPGAMQTVVYPEPGNGLESLQTLKELDGTGNNETS
jgi:hypothetical protein